MVADQDSSTGWTTSIGMLNQMRDDRQGLSWERFTDLYSVLLNYWFQEDGVPIDEWGDLRQDVFLAVTKRLAHFKHTPGRGSFRGWLRIIARNKVADYRRMEYPITNADLLTNPSPRTRDDGNVETTILLRQALDLIRKDFAEPTWRAFWMVEIENRRPAEVAEILGIKLASVYVNKARVLKRLREEFAGLLHDQPPNPPSPS